MQATKQLSFDQFLSDFQESDTFNQLLENDADRSAHEEGCFGLTHAQTMEGWRDYLINEIGHTLSDAEYAAIEKEIDDCWDWHKRNGSLEDMT